MVGGWFTVYFNFKQYNEEEKRSDMGNIFNIKFI